MSPTTPDDEFRRVLTGEDPGMARFRNVVRHFPAAPRCKLCLSPFEGVGGAVFRRVGFGRYPGNPAICSNCIKDFRKEGLTGAEIPVILPFADVRGPAGIAEGMRPAEFRAFLDGFYRTGSEAILTRRRVCRRQPGRASCSSASRPPRRPSTRSTGSSSEPWRPVAATSPSTSW